MEFQEFSGKTLDLALSNALSVLQVGREELDYEVIDKGSNALFGLFGRPVKIRAKAKAPVVKGIEDVVREFLLKVFKAMDLEVEIKIIIKNEIIDIELLGNQMGVLIGKRGQTLDSLQYLVNLVANKNSSNFYKVKMDTENYRERRRETLEKLAKNIAFKVKRTMKPVSLEPMNPFERRIIHSALQNDRYVTTKSEGEEPYRHVVVLLKKNH